ncbi:MAG: hypothetical protein Q9199_006938 [Rusavskia elegans]
MAIRIHLPEYNKSEDVLNLFETPKVPVGCQRAHGKRPPEKLTSRGRSDQPPPEEERRSAKRKASFIDDDHTNDRTIRAKFCKPKPEYQIQQSTKYPRQQIALD